MTAASEDLGNDLDALSPAQLQAMAAAAAEVRRCQRVLAKTGDSIIGELLRGGGNFQVWDHYPPGDVYDVEFHAQYYYHAHPESERYPDEHGHIHTFLRPLGMPDGIEPAPVADLQPAEDINDALSHLIGISLNRLGEPIRLFTTNRWCTGETWYRATDVERMLDYFVIDHARPSWPLNRWISALVQLFRPQIVRLLHERDAVVARWQGSHHGILVYDDRRLEVPSQLEISVDRQIARAEAAARAVRRRGPHALDVSDHSPS
ncbi:MAG: hypothetical protein GC191_00150 [Azospirillum sp.]|nr:hypothetical protein [Azospirillum sp.]